MCTRVACKLRGQDLVLEIETSFDKMHLLFTFLLYFHIFKWNFTQKYGIITCNIYSF